MLTTNDDKIVLAIDDNDKDHWLIVKALSSQQSLFIDKLKVHDTSDHQIANGSVTVGYLGHS
jgi:hypothetical protein